MRHLLLSNTRYPFTQGYFARRVLGIDLSSELRWSASRVGSQSRIEGYGFRETALRYGLCPTQDDFPLGNSELRCIGKQPKQSMLPSISLTPESERLLPAPVILAHVRARSKSLDKLTKVRPPRSSQVRELAIPTVQHAGHGPAAGICHSVKRLCTSHVAHVRELAATSANCYNLCLHGQPKRM